MRVAVDLRCLQDAWRTGVGEYTWRIAEELARRPGLSLLGYTNAAGDGVLPPEVTAVFSAIHQGRYPNRLRNLMYFLGVGPRLEDELKAKQGSFDVLWLPVPLFVKLRGSVPTVLTVHDLSFASFPQFFHRRGRLWYFPMVRRLLQRGLPANARVVAVSRHTAQDVLRSYPRYADRVQVISPGIGSEFATRPETEEIQRIRQRYSLPADYLFSLGTLEPRKNHALLLRAYSALVQGNPSYPFDLVLAGRWGWRTHELRRLLSRLACRKRVHILEYVPPQDKPALYAGAGVFLYPSFYEGYGMPVLEAMAAGVPVIASTSSSLPEVLGSQGLLLNPYRVEAWVSALRWLWQGGGVKARALAAAARAVALQQTWRGAAEKYHELFLSLVRS